jgi:hypothetical protein
MPVRERYIPKPLPDRDCVPFTTAEEAWFWFIQAHMARADGARIVAGASTVMRPCEPLDIFRAMERLYRARRLIMDHVLVLRYYGRRLMPPDPRRPKEMRAHHLWCEALERMEEVLASKGIVEPRPWYLKLEA